MRSLLSIAAAAAVFAAPAQAASVFDYGVYTSGAATLTGGSYGRVAAGTVSATTGTVLNGIGSVTGALTDRARAFSTELGGRAATGTFVKSPLFDLGLGGGLLLGTSGGVDVFNLTADEFARANLLTFAGLGSGAIVNVGGTTVSARGGLGLNLALGALAAPNVLFNFYEATAVTLTDVTLGGSILAPGALVRLNGGGAAGTVVASGLNATNALVGGRGFLAVDINAPTAVAPVPESATWATMILGLGMIGFGQRQRRAARVTFA